jgi:hypothetical protein
LQRWSRHAKPKIISKRDVFPTHQPTGARQRLAIETNAIAEREVACGVPARVPAAPAADMQSKLAA